MKLELIECPDQDLQKTILEGVRHFNRALIRPVIAGQDLAIAVRDEDGRAVGGLLGRTAAGWLAIDLIFVPEDMRGKGLATKLLRMAEAEAERRGCHSAWLDTLIADALRLYTKLGYVCFGELPDYPAGFTRTFLQKRIAP